MFFRAALLSISLSLLAIPSNSNAWDGAITGTIRAIEVTHGSNFAFRVWINDKSLCGAGNLSWGYLNEGDSNYKVYVAALLTAKATGQTVTLFGTKTLNNQFCQIGHLIIN